MKVSVTLTDYASEEAASKVFEEEKRPATEEEILADANLNAQAEAQREAEIAKYEANDNLQAWLDVASKNWKPTLFVTEQLWRGKRKEDPIDTRSMELPLELALEVITSTVPGETPDGTADNLTSQVYRALLASQAFKNALSV